MFFACMYFATLPEEGWAQRKGEGYMKQKRHQTSIDIKHCWECFLFYQHFIKLAITFLLDINQCYIWGLLASLSLYQLNKSTIHPYL